MGARSAVAVGAGRLVHWGLSSVLHRSASQLPGRIALGIDPNLMGELSHKLRKGAIVVCGTNGKTTTNNVLASSIEAAGNTVLCNRAGANMAAGVTSALLPGKAADWAVMEADELSTVHILPNLRPRYLVLLNLFRDQLDRAGEIDHVQDTIVRALESSPETTLLACGDDPLSMGVARRAAQGGTKVLTFGFCQVCGAELEYEWRSYAQLGKFRCPNGDFARPALDFRATGVRVDRTGVSFDVEGLGLDGKVHLKAGFGGVYMAYNLLAAFAAASLAGVTGEQFQRTLDGYHPKNGRLQHFEVGGREVVLNLAKNPTGFNQNISLLLADDREKAAYFVINDDFNDGKDISWIWDVDFERLAAEHIRVVCGGHRANDVQVRLKYAGIKADIAGSVGDALGRVGDMDLACPLYVLTNYSALWPAKAELERMGERHD